MFLFIKSISTEYVETSDDNIWGWIWLVFLIPFLIAVIVIIINASRRGARIAEQPYG